MKQKLTTDDPMEQKRLVKALDMAIALWDIDQMFSNVLKLDITEQEQTTVEMVRTEFVAIMKNNSIILEDIIK